MTTLALETTFAPSAPRSTSRFYESLAHERVAVRRSRKSDMERLLQGTGHAELDVLKRTASPASDALRNVWDAARASARESVRQALGEAAYSCMEEDGFKDEDIEFLRGRVVSSEIPAWEAVAALRVLGALAEDGLVLREVVLDPLQEALVHHEPERRLAAAEALWQCDAREILPLLKRQANSEEHPDVLATLKHVISIFER